MKKLLPIILMFFLIFNINTTHAQYKKTEIIPYISIDDNNFTEASTLQYTSKIVKEKNNNTIYFNWIIKEKSPCFFIIEKSFDGGYNYIESKILIQDINITTDEPLFYCYNEKNKNDVKDVLFRLKQIDYDQIGTTLFLKKAIIYSPELITYGYKISSPNKKTLYSYTNQNILNPLFFYSNNKNLNIININNNQTESPTITIKQQKRITNKEDVIILVNNSNKDVIIKVKKNKFKCFLISLFDCRIFKKDKNKYNPNKKPVKTSELTKE